VNVDRKAGTRGAALALGAAALLALGAAGCGEKSEPDVHPPTTAPTTTQVPTTTPAKPVPTPTAPLPKTTP